MGVEVVMTYLVLVPVLLVTRPIGLGLALDVISAVDKSRADTAKGSVQDGDIFGAFDLQRKQSRRVRGCGKLGQGKRRKTYN